MKITFENFLKNPALIQLMTPEEEIVVGVIYFYLEGRLMPLKDEIDREELLSKDAGTIIITPPDGLTFRFQNYSDDLVKKLETCISQDDIEFIMDKISRSLSSLLN